MATDELPDLDPAALANAEAAVARLAAAYLSWAEADIRALTACFARLEAASSPDTLAELFAVAHDMKGQGATFGYPLVTRIAQALCRRIEQDPDAVAAIGAHVAALARVVGDRLMDDGGEVGRRLLEDLGLG